MTIHSLFGPSSLRRRLLCPGSYRFEKDAPELTSPDAQRGADLHALLADKLTQSNGSRVDWQLAPGSESEAVQFCLKHVLDVSKERGILWKVKTEVKLDFTTIVPEIGHGTADAIGLSSVLDLFEFKFGHIQEQHAAENIQLAAYALAASRQYNQDCVVAWLVQPATNHISRCEFYKPALKAVEYMLKDIIEKSLKVDASLVPGEVQCRYCRAAASCPALRHNIETMPVKWESAALAPAKLGKLLDQAILAEKFIERLREYAMTQMQGGVEVPGWAVGEGRKTRDWKLGAQETLLKLAEELGKSSESVFVTKPASPGQIEAAWGKSKAVTAALNPLIVATPGKPCLFKTE